MIRNNIRKHIALKQEMNGEQGYFGDLKVIFTISALSKMLSNFIHCAFQLFGNLLLGILLIPLLNYLLMGLLIKFIQEALNSLLEES